MIVVQSVMFCWLTTALTTQVDDGSPMVREWALWGIRNMCECNEAVQRAIIDLQPVAPMQSPDLLQMGIQVEMDATSGKFSVRQVRQDKSGSVLAA